MGSGQGTNTGSNVTSVCYAIKKHPTLQKAVRDLLPLTDGCMKTTRMINRLIRSMAGREGRVGLSVTFWPDGRQLGSRTEMVQLALGGSVQDMLDDVLDAFSVSQQEREPLGLFSVRAGGTHQFLQSTTRQGSKIGRAHV